MKYKASIKFENDEAIDSAEIYRIMVGLSNVAKRTIYIEIEDEAGEIIGCGEMGENTEITERK